MISNETRASLATHLEITHKSDALILGNFGHVCVAIWNLKPTIEMFERQRGALASTVARHPGQALFLCIVSSKADPPEQDVRDGSSKMIISHERRLAGCSCVIEGSGFRAAITRTVLTGITLVVRTPAPFDFSDNVPGACEWLGKFSPRGSLTGLAAEIERARQ